MKKYMAMLTVLASVALAGCSAAGSTAAKAQPETAPGTTVQSSPAPGSQEAPDQSGGSGAANAETDGGSGAETDGGGASDGQKHHVTINVKNYGAISVELDPTYAPITVDNFISLAKSGFYNGLTFHRVIDGFMIQGGDPQGTGMGGSDKTIKGEFSNNGVNNPLSHTRGAISMARSQDMNSASSQFFIVQQDSPFLDGDYAAFGYVTSGMDVVDQICKDTPVTDGNGTVAKDKQPVIESVEVVD